MRIIKAGLTLLICLSLCACSAGGQGSGKNNPVTESQSGNDVKTEVASGENMAASFDQMHWEKGLELSHATTFFVEKCGEYNLITIADADRFLVIPEGGVIPDGVPKDVAILRKPLRHVYLASSSVFDLIREAEALDSIRLSGTKKDDLCISEAVSAMNEGRLLYAGKYNKPDYELMVAEGCDLAIENTMIYHNPEAKEKLESLGIPVLVETSSYEAHPFGRMEWIKLYGLLFDREDEAAAFFDEAVKEITPVLQQEKTDYKVAFFYVNSNGVVNVRKPGDYVAKMIELSGGEYVLADAKVEEENALSTMNMQMEDFYLAAKDADVIVYNSTIVGELNSVGDLLELSPLFADFKAVKENRVYCTEKNFFQQTTAIADFVEDLGKALRDPEQTEFHQMKKLTK
ncbi:MAG: ABC transporter substrate-binding protein [Lachnospiraceae bacterium]|nr:ABC transporter substrate-binding protein [Lachnospiraceae bacterium]